MDGLLLVDKPRGISSFDVIRRLRLITGFKKIGHAGTLDPLATGLMLMLFGPACKQAQSLTGLDKWYDAELTLGATSTTGDGEGDKTNISNLVPLASEIEEALRQFIGNVTQTPSAYSAIKINGQEAYKRARAGEVVAMPSRVVHIYEITLHDYVYPLVKIRTHVSSGTYIRSLAQDIGTVLLTGAYMSQLVRTAIGDYSLTNALNLETSDNDEISASLQDLNL